MSEPEEEWVEIEEWDWGLNEEGELNKLKDNNLEPIKDSQGEYIMENIASRQAFKLKVRRIQPDSS